MALPLVEGLTQTAKDAEPLVVRLSEVLERNPALMLASPEHIMDVVGKIAEQRTTVQDAINASVRSLGDAFTKEADPRAAVEIAHWIKEIRGDD